MQARSIPVKSSRRRYPHLRQRHFYLRYAMFSSAEFARFAAILVGLGGVIASALIFGLPWLWSLVKPLVRTLVA